MKPIKILITAGPTREPIDPVRFISNYSTGAMGYAIARSAKKRGHRVTLIIGPAPLSPPKDISTLRVTTADEMFKAVKRGAKKAGCVIMAAAVSDFRPLSYHKGKVKRIGGLKSIRLKKNPDILLWLGRHKKGKLLVGFCMETSDLVSRARAKMKKKSLDIIVANKIDRRKIAFGTGRTSVVLLSDGKGVVLKKASKEAIAAKLLDKIEQLWYKK